jgi:hypothetical protein
MARLVLIGACVAVLFISQVGELSAPVKITVMPHPSVRVINAPQLIALD